MFQVVYDIMASKKIPKYNTASTTTKQKPAMNPVLRAQRYKMFWCIRDISSFYGSDCAFSKHTKTNLVLHLSKGKRWQLRARGVHNIEKLCSIREVSAFMQRPWSANTQRGSMAFSNSYYLSSALLWVAKFHIFLNRKTADIFFRLQIQEK